MKLSTLKSHAQVVRERAETDPDYAAEADRLALARDVSAAVVRYRGEHNLTQTAFGNIIGWKQPHVARLERAEVSPSLDTLERLARAGVVEVHIERDRTSVYELAI
ncbi:helix-turn-helix domain-containing protein [Kocuria sp.]|uniref:helix-turn-helix domain-containing protein n=1 Tax=Kocuria sp. TaxID=1871328 RepID=UPI0026DF0DA4|nr:helix-turn-helix transcriptional regulator [Kocuria sp.]MDO5617767.1 helix-turn-helix transcriptional regulator [Kocuria sp.]